MDSEHALLCGKATWRGVDSAHSNLGKYQSAILEAGLGTTGSVEMIGSEQCAKAEVPRGLASLGVRDTSGS